jgi:quercetin dioxygenase-like cupin family protein
MASVSMGRGDSGSLPMPEVTRRTMMERRPINATVKTPAENFTGDVYLTPIFNGDAASRLFFGLVRFTPGARTNWHSHANGQLLQCTDGLGLVVTRDGIAIRLRAGDTVWTPAGEEHWHGATAGNMMCHYAILEQTPAGDATTWLEPVADAQYAAANESGCETA